MTVQKLADNPGGKAADAAEPKQGAYGGITVEELSSKWKEAVRELATRGVAVTNEKSALEGALTIRYNYRQISLQQQLLLPVLRQFRRWVACLSAQNTKRLHSKIAVPPSQEITEYHGYPQHSTWCRLSAGVLLVIQLGLLFCSHLRWVTFTAPCRLL